MFLLVIFFSVTFNQMTLFCVAFLTFTFYFTFSSRMQQILRSSGTKTRGHALSTVYVRDSQ